MMLKVEVIWTVVFFLFNTVIKLTSSLILTRLLFPEAFGIVTMVAAAIVVAEMSTDLGITGLFIRSNRTEARDFVNSLWSVRLTRNFILAFIFGVICPVFLKEFSQIDYLLLSRLIALYFLISGLESMYFPRMIRNGLSRSVAGIELFSTFVTTIFSVVGSILTSDYLVLIYALLLDRAIKALLSNVMDRGNIPRIAFDRASILELFNYSKIIIPSSILTLIATNSEKFIASTLFDLSTLGNIGLALTIVSLVDGLNIGICNNIYYSAICRALKEGRTSLKSAYWSATRRTLLLMCGLPASLILPFPTLTRIIYDERYHLMGEIGQLLLVGTWILAISRPFEQFYVAMDRPSIHLLSSGLRCTIIIPSLLVGYSVAGAHGFIIASVVSTIVSFLFVYYIAWRNNNLDWPFELERFIFSLSALLLGGAIGYAIDCFLLNS